MDSINEKKAADPFPFDSLGQFRNTVPFKVEQDTPYTARSYDNRARISDVAEELRSKLGLFQTRLTSSSFLSDTFSWQVKTARSSDTSKLLAKATPSASKEDFSVGIERLASARTVISEKLMSHEKSIFKTGNYAYTLTLGEETYAVELNLENEAADPLTNRSLLLAMERSVNSLGLDISATLHDTKRRDYTPYRENAFTDISHLTIAAETTGEAIAFSMADTRGDLIAALSLDRVTRFGHKNQYAVNQAPGSANSNEIPIEAGKVQAYLLGTTRSDENLKVTVNQEKSALFTELTQIINDYNDLIRWMEDNNSVLSPSLKTELFKGLSSLAIQTQTLKGLPNGTLNDPLKTPRLQKPSRVVTIAENNTIDTRLADIGLTLNTDGSLGIGEDFEKMVSGNLRALHETLAGEDGFFKDISDALDEIHTRQESAYVSARNSLLVYNPGFASRNSVYQTHYSRILSVFA